MAVADGTKEILGLWIEQSEGAKFWLRVMNELRDRGVEDVLIAILDGLNGFPEAITAAFPQTQVQTCIVHLLRHSLEFVSYKDRKAERTAQISAACTLAGCPERAAEFIADGCPLINPLDDAGRDPVNLRPRFGAAFCFDNFHGRLSAAATFACLCRRWQ